MKTAMPDLFSPSSSVREIFVLDEEQRAASQAPAGRNVVLAGAGTGKTRTLTARALHLIEGGQDPASITCVTFTTRAAREIAARIDALCDDEARPVVATFHALAARIVRRHAGRIGIRERFTIVDGDDRKAILKDLLRKLDSDRDLGEISARIDGWKASGLTERIVRDPDRPRRSTAEEVDAAIYVALRHEMLRRGMLEFKDLVLEAVDLMRSDPRIAILVSSRIGSLLVDEGQDVNPVQAEFSSLLCRVHGDVFVVGDEDQSIFSFQGGSSFGMFAIAGEDAAVWRLTHNRRSTDGILGPAVRLVSQNVRREPKLLVSGVSGPSPDLSQHQSEIEEAATIAKSVGDLIRSGVGPDRIAILARSAWVIPPVEEALLRAGIPYEMLGGTLFSKREEVKDICAYLRLALDPTDDLAFRRICNKPTRGIGPATEDAVVDHAQRAGIAFFDALSQVAGAGRGRAVGRDGLDQIANALSWISLGYSHHDWTTSEFLEVILEDRGVGYERFALREKRSIRRRKAILTILRRMASEESDPTMFLERIALAGDDEVDEQDAIPRVAISTMHGAKGLEWDHVFLPAFEKTVIPSPRTKGGAYAHPVGDPWATLPNGGVDEERRLAHVAFTRARLTLSISAASVREDKTSGRSRFLAEAGFEPILNLTDADELRGSKKVRRKGGGGRNALFSRVR